MHAKLHRFDHHQHRHFCRVPRKITFVCLTFISVHITASVASSSSSPSSSHWLLLECESPTFDFRLSIYLRFVRLPSPRRTHRHFVDYGRERDTDAPSFWFAKFSHLKRICSDSSRNYIICGWIISGTIRLRLPRRLSPELCVKSWKFLWKHIMNINNEAVADSKSRATAFLHLFFVRCTAKHSNCACRSILSFNSKNFECNFRTSSCSEHLPTVLSSLSWNFDVQVHGTRRTWLDNLLLTSGKLWLDEGMGRGAPWNKRRTGKYVNVNEINLRRKKKDSMKGGRRRWNCYLFVVLCIWNGTLSTFRSFDFQLERQRPPLIIWFQFLSSFKFIQVKSFRQFSPFLFPPLWQTERGGKQTNQREYFIFDFSHEQRMEFIFDSRMKLVSNHPNSDWPFRRQNSSTLWKQKKL